MDDAAQRRAEFVADVTNLADLARAWDVVGAMQFTAAAEGEGLRELEARTAGEMLHGEVVRTVRAFSSRWGRRGALPAN